MPYNTLGYAVADNILTLTLNRPDHLNAFTVEMAHELIDAFNRASDDDEVRAVVVTGAGRAFCAGMDLSVGGNSFGLLGMGERLEALGGKLRIDSAPGRGTRLHITIPLAEELP